MVLMTTMPVAGQTAVMTRVAAMAARREEPWRRNSPAAVTATTMAPKTATTIATTPESMVAGGAWSRRRPY